MITKPTKAMVPAAIGGGGLHHYVIILSKAFHLIENTFSFLVMDVFFGMWYFIESDKICDMRRSHY